MFDFDRIFEKPDAPVYKNWKIIIEQLNLIKDYNKNNKIGFLHPALVNS